jgi:diguanylate cyclase (GGDEF)-like protein
MRARPAAVDAVSQDERLGLLLILRIAMVVMVVLAASFTPGSVGTTAAQVAPISAAFLVVSALVEVHRRSGMRGRMLVHRAVLPLDAVYLVFMTAASGGTRSPFLILVAVQLIAVTLLAGAPAGITAALWDTFLFVLVPDGSFTSRLGRLLGLHHVVAPHAAETVLAIAGFWAVVGCTALFASVSESELRRSKDELAALASLAAGLEALTEEEDMLCLFLQAVTSTFPLRRGAIWCRRDSQPVGLVLDQVAGRVMSCPVPGAAKEDRATVMAWTQREPLLLRALDPVLDPALSALLPGATNVVVIPLQIEAECSGVVVLEHGATSIDARLPRRSIVMMAQFTGHVALALRNARLMAERERLATIDGLTGLANRREFDRVLAREVSRVDRTGEPLSLVVVDVDHFKMVNDTLGHLRGDEVLRALASVLDGAVREMDLVARYGGEEFGIVLPRCDQHDAIRVVERITSAIRRHPDLDGITVSSGLATVPFNAGDGRGLVAAADEALYESKRAGRDRYSVSGRHHHPAGN